jgi:CRISPR system Cascade subunit CasB
MTREDRLKLIKRLEELRATEDRAALATLRRALSGRDADVLRTFRHIGYQLPSYPRDQDTCILVSALFALHPLEGGVGNMGKHMARLRSADENKAQSVEHKLTALVTAQREALRLRLRQAVSLLAAGQVPVDWSQLLYDLDHWDNENRFVQRQWASSFWRTDEN